MTESWIESVRRRIREGEGRVRGVVSGSPRIEASTPRQLELPAAGPPDLPPEAAASNPANAGSAEAVLQQRFEALLSMLKESFILVDEDGEWELANPHLPS